MPTTEQMLRTHPLPVLEAIAELRNAFVESAEKPEEVIELLAAQITDPASIRSAFEEAAQDSPEAQQAIETLLRNGGEMPAAPFERKFGDVRQMGPAKLVRDMPWLEPTNGTERLYYVGLIGKGFAGEGPAAKSIYFIPSDVLPWLPAPHSPRMDEGLVVRPVAPPPAGCLLPADDSFLEDAGSLIGFLHTDKLRLAGDTGASQEDLDRFTGRLLCWLDNESSGDAMAQTASAADLDRRLHLLLHVAKRLGWLRIGDANAVELTGNRVRAFLDATRAEQRRMLWEAWRNSQEWNDLCRTPELDCANRNSWSNDPLQTRTAVLQMLCGLEPGAWYSQAEVIQAIQETEPDFQRPTGEYETWYIRSNSTQDFLKGYAQWDDVEGALLRFYLRGPLHWLQAMDLAEPTSGDDYQLSLSQWGAHWLTEGAPQPHEGPRQSLIVGEDFTVTVPRGTPLGDRFRVERFAAWQRSEPDFVYQINQRSLQRAQEEGISAQRVVEFLRQKAEEVPQNVESALLRFGESARD